MLRTLISKKLDSEERRLGVPLDYLRHMLRVSLRSFWTFTRILPISEHRRALPAAPYSIARMVATRDADCGTCLQIEVNLALAAGVDRALLRAVLESHPAAPAGRPGRGLPVRRGGGNRLGRRGGAAAGAGRAVG